MASLVHFRPLLRRSPSLLLGLVLTACSPVNPKVAKEPPPQRPPLLVKGAIAKPPTRVFAGEIPLELSGGTFIVPVVINDSITLRFTIDSGAADVSVPADVASTLVRTGTITDADFIGSKTFVLADGSTVPSAEFRLRSLKLGSLTLTNVVASISDARGPLLLGQSFLSRLSSWSIDNDRHVLLARAAIGSGNESASASAELSDQAPALASSQPVAAQKSGAVTAQEAAALSRMTEYLAVWSQPQSDGAPDMAAFYAPTVHYYGADVPSARVLADKAVFARRWPHRLYKILPGSEKIGCDPAGSCTVNAIVQWAAKSDDFARTSQGTATITVTLQNGLIQSEGSKVVSRG